MLKYSQLRGVFKLEGNRLGRPYHRLPNMFISKFEIIESRVGNYFLRKHRSSVNLKKISCEMDVHKKNTDLLMSSVGSLAFDIDRPLLLTILNNFYGLEENIEENGKKDVLLTKTEIRLRNRLALDICGMLFNEETLGLPLKIKSDSSNVLSQWAYQITFSLNDEGNSNFYILLDNAHTDFILNALRKKEKTKQNEPQANRLEQQKSVVKQIINTLPLSLNVKIAEMGMNVADLTAIKPGDILPISLPDKFPVFIGQSELFNALIVEDHDRLFISEILENIPEKSYE
ncbi:FliM/FliN family flagellar motor switch protein [Dryocola sp. BD626]|jgi:flagellar motor switch protein FliM|uniref:FliM/FliN family flagellar motor switch protein n=1 Tax=Dryocola sp. BD626 TaxID=3133273 RepID=UPI003F4F7BB8